MRSNGAGKVSPRTRCRMVRASALFLASCLSSQFDFSDKRYAVREDLTPVAPKIRIARKPLGTWRSDPTQASQPGMTVHVDCATGFSDLHQL
jgi:hypothetical protein